MSACDKSSCGKFERYNTQSKSQLKKTLKELKQQSGQLSEVKYVARLLRSKLSGKIVKAFRDHQIESNFWKYCKSMFEPRRTFYRHSTKKLALTTFAKFCPKNEKGRPSACHRGLNRYLNRSPSLT